MSERKRKGKSGKKLSRFMNEINKMSSFTGSGDNGFAKYVRNSIAMGAAGFAFAVTAILAGKGLAAALTVFIVWECISAAAPFYLLKMKVKKKKTSIELEIPDFLDRTALLIESGMQIKDALETASNCPDESFAAEIRTAFCMSESSGSIEDDEFASLEKVARRCCMPSVDSFVSIVTRNARKGSDTLCEMMRIQAEILRTDRKNTIKRMGEEAASYMIFPSVIIFIAIMIMMAAPAVFMLGM